VKLPDVDRANFPCCPEFTPRQT